VVEKALTQGYRRVKKISLLPSSTRAVERKEGDLLMILNESHARESKKSKREVRGEKKASEGGDADPPRSKESLYENLSEGRKGAGFGSKITARLKKRESEKGEKEPGKSCAEAQRRRTRRFQNYPASGRRKGR